MGKKRLAWCTDVHFDSAGEEGIVRLAARVIDTGAEGLLLTGDISTGESIVTHLSMFERELQMPVYFVAGNHDFYHTSIEQGRRQLREVSQISSFLRYMSVVPYHTLNSSTAIVGHDGWYDAMNGDWNQTDFLMNDWRGIREFVDVAPWNAIAKHGAMTRPPSMSSIVSVAQKLAHEGVSHVADGIKAAARRHRSIVVITHVPPSREAALYKGTSMNDGHVPWYTSKMMGDVLLAASKAYPSHTFTVLCGHTHNRWSGKMAHNVHLHVGAAAYGAPEVQPIFVEFD